MMPAPKGERHSIEMQPSDLDGEVRIVRDRFGMNHIFAESERDLFFAQGFNVARERLWQIDLWRRRGLGLLSEVLGPGFVAQDRASRLFAYAGDMQTEWLSYPSGTRSICEDFCRGINAYVTGLNSRGEYPSEFKALGFTPALWTAADIVRIRNNTLTTNAVSELQRALLFQGGASKFDRLRGVLRPERPDIAADPKIQVTHELIALMELAVAPVLITPERLTAKLSEVEKWTDPRTFLRRGEPVPEPVRRSPEGSNNWAIAGARTMTGFPILGNDPHRALQMPSLRYAIHLHCPTISVIGAGEPSLPGISIGHNEDVAFGLTIFPADQEDVFSFDLTSADSKSLVTQTETINVKGSGPLNIRVRHYCGSPVLAFDDEAQSGIAVRTVWSEAGAAPYLGSLALLKVRSVAEFRRCLENWRLPAVNYVAADRKNSIGWFVAGAVPRRKDGFGFLPKYSNDDPWHGFVPNDELPEAINPLVGYVMSANEYNLPPSWDNRSNIVALEWYEAFRARRIHQILGDAKPATVQSSIDLQDDAISVAVDDLKRLLSETKAGNDLSTKSENIAEMLAWNGRIDNESRVASFYSFWVRNYLKPAVMTFVAGSTSRTPPIDISIEAAIAELRGATASDSAHILRASLADADAAFGRTKWAPRRVLFRHAIQDGVDPMVSYSVGPNIWPGDDTTVKFGRSGSFAETIEFGASFRMAVDVGDWDKSLWSNVPDQTPHQDGVSTVYPMLFSRQAIARETASETFLKRVEVEPR